MPELAPDSVHTVPIDATGEVATFEISGDWDPAYTIGLNVDGDEAASYAVDLGGKDHNDDTITWFTDETEYDSTARISDAWIQAEEWLRVRVTTAAATAGSEATIYVARGV